MIRDSKPRNRSRKLHLGLEHRAAKSPPAAIVPASSGADVAPARDLALTLYSIPMMVRNTFISIDDQSPKPELAARLEDHWVDLDALVTECLTD